MTYVAKATATVALTLYVLGKLEDYVEKGAPEAPRSGTQDDPPTPSDPRVQSARRRAPAGSD